MSREYILAGELSTPVYLSETASKQEIAAAVYLNETASIVESYSDASSVFGFGSFAASIIKGALIAGLLGGSGAIVASTQKNASGSSSMSTSGVTIVTGIRQIEGAVSLSSFGDLASTTFKNAQSVSAISCVGDTPASGYQIGSASTLSGFGDSTSIGIRTILGPTALTTFGSLETTGEKKTSGTSALSTSGNVAAVNIPARVSIATLTTYGSIAATGNKQGKVQTTLTVEGRILSIGTGTKITFLAWLASNNPGRRCILLEAGIKTNGAEATRYVSDVGYTSEPTDTPANQLYTGRISGGVQFTRRLDLQGSGGSISFGDIEFDNEDGALDDWLGDIWAGRSVKLYFGDAGDAARGIAKWSRSQFELIFAGTANDILPKARNRLSLSVRDVFGPLNDTFSTATVGGTGDNKDMLLPVPLGECFNVTPVLVDSTVGGGEYAVHRAEPIERVIEVRDNGVPVEYTSAIATGRFTLTHARYGVITCDVQGAKIAGEWRTDAGGLIEWVATVLGDGNFLDSVTQIDTTALVVFRDAYQQPLQLYIHDRGNRLAIMQQLAASIGATVTTRLDGKMRLIRVGFSTPVGTIDTKNMVDGSFRPIGRPKVTGALRLNAERNWTPQQANSLAGSLVPAQLPFLTDEFVTIADSDATVVTDWKQNVAPSAVETLMVVEADIDAETARRLALWKVPYTIFGVSGFTELISLELGDTVTLTHPRFGLSAGQPALIIGVQNNWIAPQRVQLELLTEVIIPTHVYWRVNVASPGSDTNFIQIGEIQMRTTLGGADQCTGGTASAGRAEDGPASDAFDDASNTYWGCRGADLGGAMPVWIKYQFASAVMVVQYVIQARAQNGGRCPTSWTLEYSDDNSVWIVADTVIGEAAFANDESRTYLV